MKVCILGGSGQLGRELNKQLKEHDLYSFDKLDLDITNPYRCYDVLSRVRPDYIINTAAYTDVESCEEKKDLAYRTNTVGAANIAKISEVLKSKLVYISSDYVFDGKKGSSYDETDKPNPINVYGLTKYRGEIEVQNNTERYYIIRTSWLFGNRGKNFINTVLNLSSDNTILKVVDDQIGCPTYTADISLAIKSLIENGDYGTYHLVNDGFCSWYDLAIEICKIKKIDATILPLSTQEINKKASIPKNSSLNNNSKIKMRHWSEALYEYLTKKDN